MIDDRHKSIQHTGRYTELAPTRFKSRFATDADLRQRGGRCRVNSQESFWLVLQFISYSNSLQQMRLTGS